VVVLKTSGADSVAEATVKLHIGDTTEHTVAEGDGPIDALDRALRRAIEPHYPQVEKVRLLDYKVRVINSKDETAAKVRVVVESRREKADGTKEVFGTIGVSGNIIDASWQALVEAYEHHLLLTEENAAS
jgi:2-isopropylmalate synthase